MYKKDISILFVFVFVLSALSVKAQKYRMEVGVNSGTSFYMGDANNCEIFENPGFSGGFFFKYNISGRFALRGDFGYSCVEGSTYGKRASFAYGSDIYFKKDVYSADLRWDLNFFEYGMPLYVRGVSNFCPYFTAGFGFCKYQANQNEISPMIPFGVGVKIKIFKRINIGAEWVFNMLLKDNIDYVNYDGSFQLDDPYLTKSSSFKNNDWYSVFSIFISYDIKNTACKCFR